MKMQHQATEVRIKMFGTQLDTPKHIISQPSDQIVVVPCVQESKKQFTQ